MTYTAIIEKFKTNDTEKLDNLHQVSRQYDTGGQQRGLNGKKTELALQDLLRDFCYMIKPSSRIDVIRTSSRKRQSIICCKGNKGGSLDVCLDLHVYMDDIFILAVECKAYIDITMAKRAVFEAQLLKRTCPDLKCIILAMEDGMAECAHAFLINNTVLDGIFVLTLGKRSSNKPRHTIRRPIDEGMCTKFVDFLKQKVLLPALEIDDKSK